MRRKLNAAIFLFVFLASLLSVASRQVLAAPPPPSPLLPVCYENLTVSDVIPAQGTTIQPGSTVGAIYLDESAMNTNPSRWEFYFGPVGAMLPIGPGQINIQNSSSGGLYQTIITYNIPSNLQAGVYEAYIYAEDANPDRAGDCGFNDWTFNVGPPNNCQSMSVNPNPLNLAPGNSANISVNVTAGGGRTVKGMAVTTNNSNVATVGPIQSPWTQALVTANSTGNATLNTKVTLSDNSTCQASSQVFVRPSGNGPWWQANNSTSFGDIFGQNIQSQIPSTCQSPGCSPYLDLGNSIVNINTNGFLNTGAGKVNSKNRHSADGPENSIAKFNVSGYWKGRLTPIGTVLSGNLDSQQDINSLAVNPVNIYKTGGNLDINSNQYVNSQDAIIFLVNGDLNIHHWIRREQRNFLAFFVTGNINVDGNIFITGNEPIIDGMFVSDGIFATTNGQSGTNPFIANGIFVAFNGFSFSHDIGGNNLTSPAEYFLFDPSLVLTAPKELFRPEYSWEEVSP